MKWILMEKSSVESQKGTVTIQRCSVERQKDAITVQGCFLENQKGTYHHRLYILIVPFWFLNGTSFNIDSALLVLNRTSLNIDSALLALN